MACLKDTNVYILTSIRGDIIEKNLLELMENATTYSKEERIQLCERTYTTRAEAEEKLEQLQQGEE
jgi:hypothetical protein